MTQAAQHFLKRPIVVVTLAITVIICILITIQVLAGVKVQNFRVATRYSTSDQLVIATGYWYYLYSYLLFTIASVGFCVVAINKLVTRKHPNIAYMVLVLTTFILLLTLLVAYVVLSLSSGM